MKTLALTFAATAALLAVTATSHAQLAPPAPERLPAHILDIVPPSDWVTGAPGTMRVAARECRSLPAEDVRRRIVDIAVQEWAFFGFPVLDRQNGRRLLPPGASPSRGGRPGFENTTRRAPGLNAREGERVAASIAGYWAVTPEGRGVIAEQNRVWEESGLGARWNAPWSAAFISWVMCEGGLGTNERFRRAVAHWTYIDQAIRARDGQAPTAAYVAFDIGERPVQPGDLLCLGRRPQYRNLAQRRAQMGTGASGHCDIVVAVDEAGERILAIGGNVLRSVSLKVLPGERAPEGGVLARSTSGVQLYAHLQLRAAPIEPDALARSPVLAAYTCPGTAVGSRAGYVLNELRIRPRAATGALAATSSRDEDDVSGAGPAIGPRCG